MVKRCINSTEADSRGTSDIILKKSRIVCSINDVSIQVYGIGSRNTSISAIELDVRLEVELIASHEGIEIIYLPNRKGRLMKSLRTSNLPWKWLSLPADSPGQVFNRTPEAKKPKT